MKRFACALLAALLALTLLPVVGLAKTIDSAKAAPAGYTVLKRYDFETANSKITYDSSVWKRRSARSGEPSPVSGKNYMVFTPSSDYTIDTWLSDNLGAYTELPDSVQHPALSFWVYTEKNSGAPSTGDAVGVGIDQGSMGIFYATASYSTQSKTGGWRQYFVDLTQYAGKRVSFGLDVYAYKNKRVYVDDVAYVDMAIAPVALSTDTGGDFYAESRVTMQCDTPGTTIRYTADDTHPSLENGQTYTRPCDVQRGKWLLAAAFDAYGNQSAESTMYTAGALLCHPATPVTRTEKGVLYLDFTCETPGATILYTLDGSDPMMDTGKMYDGNAIPLYDDARVCVYTLADGFEDTRVYTYFVRPQRSGDVAASQDAALPLQKGTEVALSCETPGATILYTLDGSTPLPQTATVYGAPIRLDQDTWLCARSMTEDLALGNVCTFRYTVGENYDVFEPNDDLASATALGFPAQIDASLSPANDTDCYAFDVSASGRVSLAFVAQDERRDDLRMALYDAGGNMLRITNPGATGSLSQQLGAGHYFVRVTGSYGDYRLTLSKQAKVGLDLSENNLLAHMLHTTAPHSYDGGMNAGGNYLMSTAYFSRWNGPALEKDDPYTPAVNSNGTPNERKMKLVDAQAQFHVQDVLWLPLRKDSLDNDHLKSAVLAYGGVVVDYYSDWEYYTGDKGQYYYYPYDDYTAEGANHAVTLVGWDDTIPKEKFTTKYGYTPKVDGAFIFKNSWGSDWGEGGYFYASYDCELLPCYAAPLVAVGTEAADNYNVLYEYDMLGMTNAREKATSTVYTKNVYTASAATDIRAIGFYACGMEYTYDLFVQVGDGAMQPVAGGTKQYSGYYTKRLSQAVHVPQGSAFSVTVRLTTNDGDPAIYAVEMPGYDTSKAVASAGQSFVSQDSVTWEDISAAYTANNCIKVFGNADGLSADALHAGVTEQGTRGAAGEGAPLATAVVSQAGHATGSAPAAVKGSTTDSEAPIQNLPQRYDLRQTGGVTSVKNQGVIGSCWAFAAVASLESTLLRQNNTAYAYPASIAVDKAQEKLLLTAQAPTADFAATAWVTPQNIGTDLVYWTFTGDLDCIDLHSRVSRSGEQKTLFTAKGEGVVTATAVSAVDTQKQACVTIAIAKAYKPGDVNGDGYVTSMDALWALQIALGSRAATPQQLFAAKVSGGETVTSMDALRILQLATRQTLPNNGREVG